MMSTTAWKGYVWCILSLLLISPLNANEKVDNLIKNMPLRKRAGQMILVYNSPYDFLAKHNVGAVLIMQNMLKKPQALKKKVALAQKKLPIPLLVTIDQEGGTVNRLGYLPQWKKTPSAKIYTHWSQDSVTAYFERVAKVLAGLGINLNLAPVLDPVKNYNDSVTYIAQKKRCLGTTEKEIVPPAKAFVKAFTKHKIACVTKHFPGYDVTVNSDYKIAISNADSRTVEQTILPFNSLKLEQSGIMMSSILYNTICQEPAVFCEKIVTLARNISDDNIIVTDDLWGTALRAYAHPGKKIKTLEYPDSAFARIVEYTVRAGNDLLMITYPQKVPIMLDVIVGMAKKDEKIRNHVNSAVRRILLLKDKLGLLK